MTEQVTRAGRCAIIGRPNVGKSTLLNAFVGQDLAICAALPGTTRNRFLGVAMRSDPPTQLAFVDTPGLTKPRSSLGKVLEAEARAGIDDADVILMVTDVGRGKVPSIPKEEEHVLTALAERQEPIVLAVNKLDTVRDKHRLLPLLDAYLKRLPFQEIIPISATQRIQLDVLFLALAKHLPEGKLYADDFLTDRPERFLVAERIRLAVIDHTRQEVPHGAAVQIDQYTEEGNLVRIGATIVVDKESHKGIVIGARGARLKAIGTQARIDIEKLVERRVYLELFVKATPGWTENPVQAADLAGVS